MIEINLFDSNFVGQACSVALQTPRLMRYVRNQTQWDGVTVFTDRWMYSPVVGDVQSRYKIGWLHEGRALHLENYERIWDVVDKFDVIMTHDASLLLAGAHYRGRNEQWPFVKTIRGGSWVAPDQWGMYPKTKNVSMILSEKTQLEGHKLRHAIAQAGLPIDLYGPQHTPIGYDKALAYKDYRFAVVVEACKEDNFFSEHLLDALAYGCHVFYWGCPNLGQWLNAGLITRFESVSELADKLRQWATAENYFALQESTYCLQEQARAYAITEDWQIDHCLRPFVEAR